MAAAPSFVFKLSYDDGPGHVTRRYGYTGKINLPAVYSGLFDRTSQVLSLPPGTFTLALRDSLGNPSIKLDTYDHFLAHVCRPLIENPDSVKIDEKGRRVLSFLVEKKESAKKLDSSPLPSSLPPPLVSRDSGIDYSSPATTSGKTGVVELSKQFEPIQPPPKSVHPLARRFEVKKPGYNTSYSTTSTSTSTESSSTCATNPTPASVVGGVEPKKESWGTVRTMLETFVKDLNVHLADTFGDEAGSFRLNATNIAEEKEEEKEKEVKVENRREEERAAAKPVERKPVFAHVFCDRCLKTIVGPRYKCEGCSNYDLCEFCVDFRTQFHPGAHGFFEIARPGAAAVPSSRGAVEVESQSRAPVLTPLSIPPVAPSIAVCPARPVVHNASCDGCQNTIIGTRKKCIECPDYDLCSTCHENSAASIHPGHNFVSIHTPRDFDWHPRINSTPVHHHVRCDSCNKSPIRGVRYKCTHPECPDFDLCANCEADPIARHPLDHHLLKIRQPGTSLFGISAGGGVSEAVRRAQGITDLRPRGGNACGQSSNPIATLFSSIGAAVQGHAAATSSTSSTSSSASTVSTPVVPVSASVGTQVEEMREIARPAAREQDVDAVKEESSESEEEEARGSVEAAEEEEEKRLGCSFVADITLADGSIVPAGSEFSKVWRVRNTGTVAWNSARLVKVGGTESPHDHKKSYEVPDLKPGEETEVQFECKAPEDDGRFMRFFRLEDADGVKFGDRIWLDVTVESEGTLRNSATLSSSSIITPSLNAGGKAASIPATATSAAPSTTFSLSEVESDFESVPRGSISHFSSTAHSEIVVGSEDEVEDEDDGTSSSSSEESSELESDSDDEFVVLSDEGDAWRRD